MLGFLIRTILLLSAALVVQALQAPEIMLHPSLTATLGSSVRIDCAAKGDPRPTVTLYRNGVFIQGQEAATFSPLKPNVGGAKYTFTVVQGTEGPYECRATNGIADASGNTVIKKVINVIITAPQTAQPPTATKTGPTSQVITTEKNKNTGSGSYNPSAVAMIVVLSLVIAAFCCQR